MNNLGGKTYKIKDFAESLNDVKLMHYGNEGYTYYFLEIYLVLRLASPESAEEAKELLRRIINYWINAQIQKNPETNRQRQRAALINYTTQEDWKWASQLERIVKWYHKLPDRPKHIAAITFMGNNYFFDCPKDFRPNF